MRQEKRQWTERDTALLKKLKAEGLSHTVIRERMGFGYECIARKWKVIELQREREAQAA